jgi:peptidoglycan/LPS O-acetylase OafA/YrhL
VAKTLKGRPGPEAGPAPTEYEPAIQPALPAWRTGDWETLFVVGVLGLILLGTLWMVLISVTDSDPDNKFRIVPAAAVMVMVELWLIIYLPRYDKLAFWGAAIALATYLFFAVPFLFLGLLPLALTVVGTALVGISLVCCLLLYRQRARFFPPPPPKAPRKK